MLKVFSLICLFPFSAFSQIFADKNLTDTSSAIGIVLEDCFVGKSVSDNCINQVDQSLSKKTSVIICGVKKCSATYMNSTNLFYEIIYKKETYFIEKDKLVTYDNYYSDIEKMSSESATTFRNHALRISESLYKYDLNRALTFLENCKHKGLAILDWSYYDESEYTQGTSAKIKVYNPTAKTVKYIWFTFIGYNPVNDVVYDKRHGSSKITVKAVGPLKPEESGEYTYTYVWFTDLVETAKITNIKVQYMDGSFKTISNPKDIVLPKSLYNIIFDDN